MLLLGDAAELPIDFTAELWPLVEDGAQSQHVEHATGTSQFHS